MKKIFTKVLLILSILFASVYLKSNAVLANTVGKEITVSLKTSWKTPAAGFYQLYLTDDAGSVNTRIGNGAIGNPIAEDYVTSISTTAKFKPTKPGTYKVTMVLDVSDSERNLVNVPDVNSSPIVVTAPQTVDKKVLLSTLEKAKAYKADDYTTATFNALKTAIKNAEAVSNNASATQAQVDQQVNALNSAIQKLVKKPPVEPTPPVETKPEEPVYKTRTETRTEVIEFETEYRDDNTLNVGQRKVIRKGVNGTKRITYNVKYVEGDKSIPEDWVKESEEVTKEPIDAIIARGTKTTTTNLKSLYVDGASISPAFKTNVTTYTFQLKEAADSVNVRAEAQSSDAKVTGTGLVTLTKPSHEMTVTVSLEGKSTSYKLTIVQPETEVVDAKITYNNQEYKVIKSSSEIAGFSETMLKVGEQELPVLSNNKGINVLELEGLGKVLINDQGEIYSRYNPVVINGETYFAIDIPEEGRDLDQLVYSEFKLGSYTIYGFKYEDPTREKYNIFYLQNQEGEISEYLYNTDDQTLVLLSQQPIETPAEETPVETETETESEVETSPASQSDIQQLVIYGGLVVVGILLIVLLLLIIKRMKEARR